MKFDELYKKVFVVEAVPKATEVADPANFDDVDPLPLPPTPEEETGSAVQPEPAVDTTSSSTLTDYISQLDEFANKLNGTDSSSLQTLVSKLDKVETPFEGIYARTSAEIVDAAKTLRSISEKIKNFIIHAAKK